MGTVKKPTLEELHITGERRWEKVIGMFAHIDCDYIKFTSLEALHWMKRYPTMICGGEHEGLKWLLMQTGDTKSLYVEQNDEILLGGKDDRVD